MNLTWIIDAEDRHVATMTSPNGIEVLATIEPPTSGHGLCAVVWEASTNMETFSTLTEARAVVEATFRLYFRMLDTTYPALLH